MKAVPTLVNLLSPAHEHEFEAVHGLPEPLPPQEVQLWQGSPDARLLARQALHLDLLLLYFGALLAWRGIASWHDGAGAADTLLAMAGMLPLIGLALGLLGGIAWLMARTTVYTLTNRRVVMRVGVVLSITFNLPFRQIAAAGWRQRGAGGDIVLSLAGSDRIAYLHLWPHVRPWRLRRTEPMLRALADAPAVARILADALAQAQAARGDVLTARGDVPNTRGNAGHARGDALPVHATVPGAPAHALPAHAVAVAATPSRTSPPAGNGSQLPQAA